MTASVATSRLGIVELVTICDAMAHRHRTAFTVLGAWIRTSDAPTGAIGRALTEACHRHAELAELWTNRQPAIPGEPAGTPSASAIDDVSAWYRAELDALRSDTTALRARIDPVLDPGTRRVIERVVADLDAIADRLG